MSKDHWEDWPEGDKPDPIMWLWVFGAVVGGAFILALAFGG